MVTRRGFFAMLAGLPLVRRLPVVQRQVTLAQADWVNREALRMFRKQFVFHKQCFRASVPRIGDTITVRRPPRFTSTTACNR